MFHMFTHSDMPCVCAESPDAIVAYSVRINLANARPESESDGK